MGVKNFKRLLISILKCIELNSEPKPKLILIWVLAPNRDPEYMLYLYILHQYDVTVKISIRSSAIFDIFLESIKDPRKRVWMTI